MAKSINTLTAWSYSRLTNYESCARAAKLEYIDKIKGPSVPAMVNGNKVHQEAAKFLEGKADEVPDSCVKFKSQFWDLRELHPIVEKQQAFKKNLRTTGWFDKRAWLRVILDVDLDYDDHTCEIIDHKTGKFRGEMEKLPNGDELYTIEDDSAYAEQMKLFSAVKYIKDPKMDLVTTRLWFLDHGIEVIKEYGRDEALDAFDELSDRAEVMLNAERFPPSPSWKCGYCPYSLNGTGHCEYK